MWLNTPSPGHTLESPRVSHDVRPVAVCGGLVLIFCGVCREPWLAGLLGASHEVSWIQSTRRAPEGTEYMNICCIAASPLLQVNISTYWTSHHSCPSWTTSQEPSRSAGRTDCGEICPRCKVALANKSLAFFLGLLFFLRTSSCSVRPGRTAAPGRNGSSNLYAALHRA